MLYKLLSLIAKISSQDTDQSLSEYSIWSKIGGSVIVYTVGILVIYYNNNQTNKGDFRTYHPIDNDVAHDNYSKEMYDTNFDSDNIAEETLLYQPDLTSLDAGNTNHAPVIQLVSKAIKIQSDIQFIKEGKGVLLDIQLPEKFLKLINNITCLQLYQYVQQKSEYEKLYIGQEYVKKYHQKDKKDWSGGIDNYIFIINVPASQLCGFQQDMQHLLECFKNLGLTTFKTTVDIYKLIEEANTELMKIISVHSLSTAQRLNTYTHVYTPLEEQIKKLYLKSPHIIS